MPIPRNLYKSFRDVKNINALVNNSKRWDEPTYLTFSVFFKSGITEKWRNSVLLTNFDWFPHPLLATDIQDNYSERTQYSTIQYLRDNNETVREEMLKRFISDLNDIQDYYPWYFQSISGINQLLAVVPERGRRVPIDAKLTMKVLEGIDQKMSNLLNLYKKVAWDDTYQRWMLPDMMRNFVMEIYVTEFRTFHTPTVIKNDLNIPGNSRERRGLGKFLGNIFNTNAPNTGSGALDVTLDSLQRTLPTLKIVCERCEIDINSINRNIDNFSVADMPDQSEIEFDIKVGLITEEYVNPILDYYYSDKVINGKERTKEFIPGLNINKNENALNPQLKPGEAEDGQTFNNPALADPLRPTTGTEAKRALSNPDFAQREMLSHEDHITGTPYHENRNSLKSINQAFGTVGSGPKGSTFQPNFDPTEPNTWSNNAVKFGTSFLEDFVEEKIDKSKMTKIPGLGISITEAVSAIESKNFVTVFGLIKEAINKVQESTQSPSSLLDSGIVVPNTLRQFLKGVATSEATDGDSVEIKNFASLALNDDSIFGQIMDFSKATDLVASELGEINIPNPIKNPTEFANIALENSGFDRSKATDLDGNTSGLKPEPLIYDAPSSSATNRPITNS